ncbi:MAG: hypothetical protein FWF18_01040 [Dehalococcoidia bacterium]|nr:hypothetical protein [Dehalococcoidia bacterium]
MKYRNDSVVSASIVAFVLCIVITALMFVVVIWQNGSIVYPSILAAILVLSVVIGSLFAYASIVIDERGIARDFLLWRWRKWTWEDIVEIGIIDPYITISYARTSRVHIHHPAHIYFSTKDNKDYNQCSLWYAKDKKYFVMIPNTQKHEEYILRLAKNNPSIRVKFRGFPAKE